MNRRERVKAAIAHTTPDRPPRHIEFCGDTWETIKAHVDAETPLEFLDSDVMQFGIPWWGFHELADDWRQPGRPTSLPKSRGGGNYHEFYENLARAREQHDHYFLVPIYGAHWERAWSTRGGMQNFFMDMMSDPGFARYLLTTIIDRNCVMMENVLSCPEIDGVLLGSDWGSQADILMSVDLWDDMIRPGEQRMYDLVRAYGKDVWVHSCGNVVRLLPRLIEMGVDVLNPIQPEAMDLAYLKNTFGDRLTFWGGINTQQVLPYATPDEVRAETRRVRDLMGRDGGYVLAPGQQIQSDVPLENILALVETSKELD